MLHANMKMLNFAPNGPIGDAFENRNLQRATNFPCCNHPKAVSKKHVDFFSRINSYC